MKSKTRLWEDLCTEVYKDEELMTGEEWAVETNDQEHQVILVHYHDVLDEPHRFRITVQTSGAKVSIKGPHGSTIDRPYYIVNEGRHCIGLGAGGMSAAQVAHAKKSYESLRGESPEDTLNKIKSKAREKVETAKRRKEREEERQIQLDALQEKLDELDNEFGIEVVNVKESRPYAEFRVDDGSYHRLRLKPRLDDGEVSFRCSFQTPLSKLQPEEAIKIARFHDRS